MLTIDTSASFWTDSRRSASRSLLKRPVTRCLTGWTSGVSNASTASSRIMSSSLVGLEERTLDQFVQEASDPPPLDPDAVHDAGDVVAVAERHVAAGRIASQLLHEVLEEMEGIRGE